MTGTAVAVRPGVELPSMDVMQVGAVLAQSGYFKDAKDASQAVVKVLYGQEIGIGPVTAMMGIHVIEGKPALSANLIAARIKASGRYDYRVREHSGERCRVEFFQRSAQGWEPLGVVEWSMQDAQRAGLGGRGPWKSYPRAMLFARAISEGARVHCPEIFGGAPVYTPEELGADVDAEGNLVAPIGGEPEERLASDAQLELIQKMMQSSVVTTEERLGIEKRLGRGMSLDQASACIDWLQTTIKDRKAAAKAEAASEPAEEAAEGETVPAGVGAEVPFAEFEF